MYYENEFQDLKKTFTQNKQTNRSPVQKIKSKLINWFKRSFLPNVLRINSSEKQLSEYRISSTQICTLRDWNVWFKRNHAEYLLSTFADSAKKKSKRTGSVYCNDWIYIYLKWIRWYSVKVIRHVWEINLEWISSSELIRSNKLNYA